MDGFRTLRVSNQFWCRAHVDLRGEEKEPGRAPWENGQTLVLNSADFDDPRWLKLQAGREEPALQVIAIACRRPEGMPARR